MNFYVISLSMAVFTGFPAIFQERVRQGSNLRPAD